MIDSTCRCCGKAVVSTDRHPIHTRCIVRHWDQHRFGRSATRCKEYGAPVLGRCAASRDHVRYGREARNAVRVDHGGDVEYLTTCNTCAVRVWEDCKRRGVPAEVTGPAVYEIK